MKIVDRDTLVKMPVGTLFSRFRNQPFGGNPLHIGYSQHPQILLEDERAADMFPNSMNPHWEPNFGRMIRDGASSDTPDYAHGVDIKPDVPYLVFEKADIKSLIGMLMLPYSGDRL